MFLSFVNWEMKLYMKETVSPDLTAIMDGIKNKRGGKHR